MTVPRKEKKRESRREEKALRAAQIENVIEKELLERLNKGVYPDICNYDEEIFNKLLDNNENQKEVEEEEEEAEVEYVEGDYELEEEEELEDDIEDMGDLLKANDFEDIVEDEDPLEEQPAQKKKKSAFVSYPSEKNDGTDKVKRKGKKFIVEVERDEDMDNREHNIM